MHFRVVLHLHTTLICGVTLIQFTVFLSCYFERAFFRRFVEVKISIYSASRESHVRECQTSALSLYLSLYQQLTAWKKHFRALLRLRIRELRSSVVAPLSRASSMAASISRRMRRLVNSMTPLATSYNKRGRKRLF